MDMIKIGMIGMSEGNAHPYSWSAIINGHYDGAEIARVGYPAVSTYLDANRDTLGIPDAQVTHVWCQERSIASSIAQSSHIAHVVDQLEDMVGAVDAVILGRADLENNLSMAKPFIEAGIPIFIDKPLTYSRQDLAWFAEQHNKGKFIMSCSSMRYANEGRNLKQRLASLGKVELVTAVGKKDWKKYGIHLLEAVFSILDDPRAASVQHIGELDREVIHLRLESGVDISLHLFNAITGTFQVSFFGQKGWELVDIHNSYSMFRDNLIEFVRSVREGKPRIEFGKTHELISIIIAAAESRQQQGKRIILR